MMVLVFAMRRPDMDFWSCEGHATTDEELVLIKARVRADPNVFRWHVCEDLDHDIDVPKVAAKSTNAGHTGQ